MAHQAGEIRHDDSWGNMWLLYKSVTPDATVATFKPWMAELVKIQETVQPCPWCKSQPALRVIPHEGKLVYDVKCEDDFCPVKPQQVEVFDNPEEAVAEWAYGT